MNRRAKTRCKRCQGTGWLPPDPRKVGDWAKACDVCGGEGAWLRPSDAFMLAIIIDHPWQAVRAVLDGRATFVTCAQVLAACEPVLAIEPQLDARKTEDWAIDRLHERERCRLLQRQEKK